MRPSARAATRRNAPVALVAATLALAGCSPGDGPGPRGLLHVDAPVLVAMEGEPVAASALAPAAAARDAGARLVAAVVAGVGAPAATPGVRMLGAPLAALEAAPEAPDCAAGGEALRETLDTLRAALRPAGHETADAFRRGVDREWHPTRPDPVVAATVAPPALDAARRDGHPVVLSVGPVTLSPASHAGRDGCRAAIEARVVMRAVRTFDGGVRFETVRRLTLAEASDADALRAWAADPERVGAALQRLGERLAADVRWLL
jgi:hypothetical protein